MNKTRKACFVICTLSALLLIRCSTVKKPSYQKVKTVSFELPYIPSTWGYFYEKDSLYFYTHNYPTYKNIDILNQNGKVIHSIDLRKLITDKIKVEIHSFDSVYVLNKEPAILYWLNKNGLIIRKILIDSLFYHQTIYNKGKCKHFEVYSFGDIIHKGNLLTVIHVIDTLYRPSASQNMTEILLYNNKYLREKPQLLQIKNVLNSSARVIHDANWINKTIREEDEEHPVFPSYTYIEDKITFYFSYDKHIYFVNSEDLSFERKIPIYSDYTELEYKKKKITEKRQMYVVMYKGAILQVYNKNNEHLVLLRHEVPFPEKEEMISPPDRFETRYSVIIYDKQWKKQKEILLPEKEKFVAFLPKKQFITQSKTKNARQVTLNFYQLTE